MTSEFVHFDKFLERIRRKAYDRELKRLDPALGDLLKQFNYSWHSIKSLLENTEKAFEIMTPPPSESVKMQYQIARRRIENDISAFEREACRYASQADWEQFSLYFEHVKATFTWIETCASFLYAFVLQPFVYCSNEEYASVVVSYIDIPIITMLSKRRALLVLLRKSENQRDLECASKLESSSRSLFDLIVNAKAHIGDCRLRKHIRSLLSVWLTRCVRLKDRISQALRQADLGDLESVNVAEETSRKMTQEEFDKIYETARTFTSALEDGQREFESEVDKVETVPRFDDIPILKLVEVTFRLLEEHASNEALQQVANAIQMIPLEVTQLIEDLKSVYGNLCLEQVTADQERRLHEIWCHFDTARCPLNGVNHYFVPAVELHIRDVNRLIDVVDHISASLKVNVTAEYAPDLITHLVGMLETHQDLLMDETRITMEDLLSGGGELQWSLETRSLQVAAKDLVLAAVHLTNVSIRTFIADEDGRLTRNVNTSLPSRLVELKELARKILEKMPTNESPTAVFANRPAEMLRDLVDLCAKWSRELDTAGLDTDCEQFSYNVRKLMTDLERTFIELVDPSSGQMHREKEKLNADPQRLRDAREALDQYLDAISISELVKVVGKLPKEIKGAPIEQLRQHTEFNVGLIADIRKDYRQLPITGIIDTNLKMALAAPYADENFLLAVEKLKSVGADDVDDIVVITEAINLIRKAEIRLLGLRNYYDYFKKDGLVNPYKRKTVKGIETYIGGGGFGTVHSVKYNTGLVTALKRIPIKSSDGNIDQVIREIDAVKNLKHDGIVTYYRSWLDHNLDNLHIGTPLFNMEQKKNTTSSEATSEKNLPDFAMVYLEMKFYTNGALRGWLKQNNTQEGRVIKHLKIWLAQLCDALDYVHGKGVIHRDLKPENIFLREDSRIVIGDFGVAALQDPAQRPESADGTDGKNTSGAGGSRTAGKGTEYYMAPEQLGSKYDNKVDIYALGKVYCEMVFADGEVLLHYSEVEPQEMEKGAPDELWEAYKFHESLIEEKPVDRPSCYEILQLGYLKNVNYNIVQSGSVDNDRDEFDRLFEGED